MDIRNVEEFVRRGQGAQAAVDEALKQAAEAGKSFCVKCGRVFTSPSEWRYNAQRRPICRKPCRGR